MDLKEFKAKYPDLYKLIFEEGSKAGKADGFEEGRLAGIEEGKAESREEALVAGAQAETQRIKDIEALLIPGHEALIQTLKFDGKTTAAEAAIKLVQAENAVRQNAVEALAVDGVKPVAHAGAPEEGEEGKTFEQLVADYMAANSCKRSKAISAIAKAYPKEHAAYLAATNKKGGE